MFFFFFLPPPPLHCCQQQQIPVLESCSVQVRCHYVTRVPSSFSSTCLFFVFCFIFFFFLFSTYVGSELRLHMNVDAVQFFHWGHFFIFFPSSPLNAGAVMREEVKVLSSERCGLNPRAPSPSTVSPPSGQTVFMLLDEWK